MQRTRGVSLRIAETRYVEITIYLFENKFILPSSKRRTQQVGLLGYHRESHIKTLTVDIINHQLTLARYLYLLGSIGPDCLRERWQILSTRSYRNGKDSHIDLQSQRIESAPLCNLGTPPCSNCSRRAKNGTGDCQ